MTSTTLYTSYDPLARVYNEDWASGVLKQTLPALEKLLLPNLAKGSHILDLGCGTGQLAKQLIERGYKITGIDASEGMLRYGSENAPEAELILQDARSLNFPPTFDCVISIGAFNHVLNLEELTNVFKNVYQSLLSDSIFLFYIFLEEEYELNWHGKITGNVKDEYAWAARNRYDSESKIAQINLTIFSLLGSSWQRTDSTILERCFPQEEIQSALETAGFGEITMYDSHRDLEVSQMPGSVYFVCYKH